MHISELVLIAIGLSMDAFAVSVSNGMAIPKVRLRDALTFGIYFGAFQALMPLIGWAAGKLFSSYITSFDHWIAFVLLAYIGIKMIREAYEDNGEEPCGCTHYKIMLILAIATSIDALAAGITFAGFPDTNIWLSIAIIGGITFFVCTLGALLGKKIGEHLGRHAQTAGGAILIAMGIKILVEHLFF